MQTTDLLKYLDQSTCDLLENGQFDNGWPFRNTQREAFEAYTRYLNDKTHTERTRLSGYFEIPTGVGKSAMFGSLVGKIQTAALNNGDEFNCVIVVPTKTLMEQTYKVLLGDNENNKPGVAEHLRGQVGKYCDEIKQLDKPVTIITYNSWVKLTKEGVMSSDNVQLLISDEAHKGTSEERIEVANYYDERTAKLALTATAEYDQEKTVEQSHGNRIFYKSINDAYRDGELTAYIDPHIFVMQMFPPDDSMKNEFEKQAQIARENGEIVIYDWMKINWNHQVTAMYRDMEDAITGDPLTDNQAGFYCMNTRQADHLADTLNSDAVLSQRAVAKGCKGVAVSIHSNMQSSERTERLQAYERGEYMALVGDDMFKEGFDHPPMKVIFDSPHKSLLEKSQIIGRPMRRWYNEVKQRWEGTTIIDTMVYEGSHDPKVNAKNEERARRGLKITRDILREDRLLDPHIVPTGSTKVARPPAISGVVTQMLVTEETHETFIFNRERLMSLAQLGATIKQVQESASATLEATGRRPTAADGEVLYGPLAGKTTWAAIDRGIKVGHIKGPSNDI